jgi:hypothetical protein
VTDFHGILFQTCGECQKKNYGACGSGKLDGLPDVRWSVDAPNPQNRYPPAWVAAAGSVAASNISTPALRRLSDIRSTTDAISRSRFITVGIEYRTSTPRTAAR